MQPHEQAQFFEMIGRAIAGQVQLATAPLLQRIKDLEDVIVAHVNKPVDVKAALADADYATVPCVQSLIDARLKEENENLTDADVDEIVSKAGESTKRMIDEALAGVLTKDAVVEIAEQIFAERIPTLKDGEDGAPGQDGKDGTSVTVQDIEPVINAKITEEISKFSVVDGKDGKDGKDVDMEKVTETILYAVESYFTKEASELRKFVEELPKPKDGKDGNDGQDGADGKPGVDGKSVTADEIIPLVDGAVAKAVAAIPVPPSMVGTVIDREGCLHITLSDGSTHKVGVVVGRDGLPGKDGDKGIPGKDGRDLVDFKWKKVGDRLFEMTYKLTDGTVATDTVKFDQMIYRNYWKEGRKYEEGDTVHHGGGLWVALKETEAQPDTLNSGWQLAVKRGRTGSPGLKGDPGKDGKNGRDGRDGLDLTQMGPDGSKWR